MLPESLYLDDCCLVGSSGSVPAPFTVSWWDDVATPWEVIFVTIFFLGAIAYGQNVDPAAVFVPGEPFDASPIINTGEWPDASIFSRLNGKF